MAAPPWTATPGERCLTAVGLGAVTCGTVYGILFHLWSVLAVSGGVLLLGTLAWATVLYCRRRPAGAGAGAGADRRQVDHPPMAVPVSAAANAAPAAPTYTLHSCGIFVPHHASVCCICLEIPGERLLLPCLHAYHPACIAPWFARKRTCPLCGADPWFTGASAARQRPPIEIPSSPHPGPRRPARTSQTSSDGLSVASLPVPVAAAAAMAMAAAR